MTLDGWQDLPLSELATVVGGGTPSRSQPTYWNGDVPWATPTDVTGLKGRVISETASTITDEGLANSSSVLLPPRSLLMTTRATIGACAVNQVSMATNQGFQSLVPKEGARVEFLYYLIQHHKRRLERLAAGSTFLEVSKRAIRDFRVVVPPLPEQRKIAAILSSVDDMIEKTQSVIDQVQVVKRGLMQVLLTRGLPGRHTRFKPTEHFGNIPKGWTIRSLDDACVSRGQYGANVAKREFEPGGIRYIRITDIDRDGTLKDVSVGIDTADADGYLLRPGDILLARSGATVGKSYLHEGTRLLCAFAGYLVRFRTREEVLLPAFLKEYLNTAMYWRWVADRQRAQAQPNINATEYGQLPVPCPHLDEQRRIVEIAAGFTDAIQTSKAEIRSRQQLKQALLSVLLTGELRVTPVPESA